jgi:hypothetical protein
MRGNETRQGMGSGITDAPGRADRAGRAGTAIERLRDAVQHGRDEGAATAEYVVATMAAVGFAGLLVIIMRSDEVRGILTDLVRSALTVAG